MSQAKDFLNLLFNDDDIINFRLIGKNVINKWWTFNKADYDFLKQKNKEGYNIYFGGNPRKEKGIEFPSKDASAEDKTKGKGDASVEICRNLFVDFDHKDFPSIPWENFLSYIKTLTKNFPPPLFITLTGGGYHCWWILSKSLNPQKWTEVQIHLNKILSSDGTIKNPERIMRLPGFLNVKREPFVECRIVEFNHKAISKLEDIEKHFKTNFDNFSTSTNSSGSSNSANEGRKIGRPTWIEEELIRLDLINKKESNITASGDVFVKAPDPARKDSYRTSINIFTGRWNDFSHDHSKEELKNKEFKSGGALKYFTLTEYKVYTIESKEKTKLALINRYEKRFVDWWMAIAKRDYKDRIYNSAYPEKTATKILKKYFTIPDGEPEAGMIAFYYFDGKFYYGHEKTYISVKSGYLNSLLWCELSHSGALKKGKESDKIIPFPVNQRIVDNIIKAIIGIRNLRYIIVENGSYKRDEEVENIFWINKRPELPDAENLIVAKNKIINYKNLDDYDLTLNLFCTSPLNVKYDLNLPQPKRCEKFLIDNFENKKQINEVLKRDAYLCLPTYLENTPAFFVMKGKTGSGKGTNIDFLREILGRNNYEEISFLALGELFGLQKLIGILVAFISDMEDDSVTKSQKGLVMERMKKMSSGIDYVDIRLVGGEWISIKLPTKFVLATPILPTFPKSVSEFIRRIQITVYKKQYSFDKEKFPDALDPDDDCLANMVAEKDAYFTHFIIGKGLKLLLKEGFKSTEEAKENIQEIKTDSNPFEDFYRQCVEENENEKILNDTLLKVCKCWGRATGRLKKYEIEELTFAKITKGIRRDIDIKTDLDTKTRKTYLCNGKLTEYAENLIRENISEF